MKIRNKMATDLFNFDFKYKMKWSLMLISISSHLYANRFSTI